MKTRKLEINARGNDKQFETAKLWADKITEEIVYGGAKASGKSFLGCSLIFGTAFLYQGTMWFIARKTLADLRKHTIPSIVEVFNIWGITNKEYRIDTSKDNCYRLNNGSVVFLLEAKDMPSDPKFERFGSMQMTGGWIEEAGEFSRDAKNNLGASVGRWKNEEYDLTGKLLMTCNPSKNFLYTDYYLPYKEGNLPKEKAFIQALPTDNKQLSKGYIERLERTLTPEQKERLLKGNWEYDDDPNTMIKFEDIVDIFTNTAKVGEKWMSVDVARLGADTSRIVLWDGLKSYDIITVKSSTLDILIEKIKLIEQQERIPRSHIVVDGVGLGAGVVDHLKGCRIYISNAAAIKENESLIEKPDYSSLNVQCAYKLAELALKHEIEIRWEDKKAQEMLVEELQQLKTERIDKPGKLRIVDKDTIKQMIGRSPDIMDAIIMRMIFEIKPVSIGGLRVVRF